MIVLNNILVATDFSPASDAALTYGRALAKEFGARLHLLHAADNDFLRAAVTDPHVLRAGVARRLDERLTAEGASGRHTWWWKPPINPQGRSSSTRSTPESI